MNFEGLIRKYSQTYTITTTEEGYFDGPTWVDGGEVVSNIECAIFPISAEEVENYEGLGYDTQDIQIFIPVSELETTEINKADTIEYQGYTYIFDSVTKRDINSDFHKWFAKRKEVDTND